MGNAPRRRMKLEISLYAHATEDEGILLESVERVLGIRPEEIEREQISGHHGNPITVFRAVLSGDRAVEVLRGAAAKMDAAERELLRESIDRAIDDRGKVHLRFDKQGLVLGSVRMGRRDPVGLTISPGPGREDVVGLLIGILEGGE